MHVMCWAEVSYEIHDHGQNFYKSKLPFFHVFHEFNFWKIYINVNKATLLTFYWNKYTSNSNEFHYLLNTYLIHFFVFPKESISCPSNCYALKCK